MATVDRGNSLPLRGTLANYQVLTGENLNVQPTDNPEFAWPNKYIRQIDGSSRKLQRGFIRSILTDADVQKNLAPNSGAKTRRLWFQFNPDFIERAVSQQIGSTNPLLQSPSNLIQAVPGTSTFGFTLQFNREMEVAKGSPFTIYEENTFEYLQSLGPEKIGVMADLLVFDNIIGQGISSDIVELLSAYLDTQTSFKIDAEKRQAEANNAQEDKTDTPSDADNAAAEGKNTNAIQVTPPFNADDFKKQAELIYGNSAFLNPLPVRVVFSDLFMIEGLITATNVGFQKFSETMVPTVCQINIQMEALYFGFAKKKAYLTQQLTTWSKIASDDRDTSNKERNDYELTNKAAFTGIVTQTENKYHLVSSNPPAYDTFEEMTNPIIANPGFTNLTVMRFSVPFSAYGDNNILREGTPIINTPSVTMKYNGSEVPIGTEVKIANFKQNEKKEKGQTFYIGGSFDVYLRPWWLNSGSSIPANTDIEFEFKFTTQITYTSTVSGEPITTNTSDFYVITHTYKANTDQSFSSTFSKDPTQMTEISAYPNRRQAINSLGIDLRKNRSFLRNT